MAEYKSYKDSIIPWIDQLPAHWDTRRAKYMFKKEKRDVRPEDRVITCFRDGQVTLRENRRTTGFTESVTEAGYQGIREGDLVIHQMDAFAGSIGVSDSDGKGTSVYHCCTPTGPYMPKYYAYALREMARAGFIQSLYRGIRERSSDFNFFTFGKQFLPVPPLKEQELIVAFLNRRLSDIESFLAGKQQQLELIKESIEHYMFCGDSEDERLIDSWQEAFPATWKLISGKQLFRERNIKNQVNERFLAATQNKGVVYKDECEANFVTASDPRTQKLVCENDFVISLRSFQGGIEFSKVRGIISAAYVVMHLREQFDTQELRTYYRFLLKSRPFVTLLGSLSDSLRDGKSIKYEEFGQFYYPIPDDALLKKVNQLAFEYDTRCAELDSLKDLLQEYKQRLISDVVTGRIDVRSEEIA